MEFDAESQLGWSHSKQAAAGRRAGKARQSAAKRGSFTSFPSPRFFTAFTPIASLTARTSGAVGLQLRLSSADLETRLTLEMPDDDPTPGNLQAAAARATSVAFLILPRLKATLCSRSCSLPVGQPSPQPQPMPCAPNTALYLSCLSPWHLSFAFSEKQSQS